MIFPGVLKFMLQINKIYKKNYSTTIILIRFKEYYITHFEVLVCADVEFFTIKVFYRRLVLGAKRVVQKPFTNGTFSNASVTKHHQSSSLWVGHDILY